MLWLRVTACVAGSYLLGAVPFGVLLARAGGVDLRAVGSGNIGATNVARALGPGRGVVVFLLDAAKGAAPTLLARLFLAEWCGVEPLLLAALCAVAAVLGHVFPVYLRFRGGKGVATGAGATVALAPAPAAIAVGCWAVTLLVFRYVSLASLVAALALPAAHLALSAGDAFEAALPVTVYAFCVAALVWTRHASNIGRLLRGEEPKIGRKSRGQTAAD